MRKNIIYAATITIFMVYAASYAFWHAFFGTKNIHVARSYQEQYHDKLAMFQHLKIRNLALNNQIEALQSHGSDFEEQKMKETGFIAEDEICVTEEEFARIIKPVEQL